MSSCIQVAGRQDEFGLLSATTSRVELAISSASRPVIPVSIENDKIPGASAVQVPGTEGLNGRLASPDEVVKLRHSLSPLPQASSAVAPNTGGYWVLHASVVSLTIA